MPRKYHVPIPDFRLLAAVLAVMGSTMTGTAADVSAPQSTSSPSDNSNSSESLDKIPKKKQNTGFKTSTSNDLSQRMNVVYENKVSDDVFIYQENNWDNPSSPVSTSGIENKDIRKFKNSNVWSADWRLLDKLHFGASTSIDKEFQQGDAAKQYQVGKDVFLKWNATPSTEIKAGQYNYTMLGEDWGTSDNTLYYTQARQKLGSLPLTVQLKPAVNYEKIDNTDNTMTTKDGRQIESSIDWKINQSTTWTLGSTWKNTTWQNTSETELNKNLYSKWNIAPTSRYNLSFSTLLEKYKKEDYDASLAPSQSDKVTIQFGQKVYLDDDLTASFDVWQSTTTHATPDIEQTKEHAATISIQKRF